MCAGSPAAPLTGSAGDSPSRCGARRNTGADLVARNTDIRKSATRQKACIGRFEGHGPFLASAGASAVEEAELQLRRHTAQPAVEAGQEDAATVRGRWRAACDAVTGQHRIARRVSAALGQATRLHSMQASSQDDAWPAPKASAAHRRGLAAMRSWVAPHRRSPDAADAAGGRGGTRRKRRVIAWIPMVPGRSVRCGAAGQRSRTGDAGVSGPLLGLSTRVSCRVGAFSRGRARGGFSCRGLQAEHVLRPRPSATSCSVGVIGHGSCARQGRGLCTPSLSE